MLLGHNIIRKLHLDYFPLLVSGYEKVDNISVPNRQNTVPLHLVKWKYRVLKFLVHFSSFLLTNVPQK